MNLNAIITILITVAGVLTSIMGFLPGALGCVADVSGGFDCTNSWLPPTWAAAVAGLLAFGALVLKVIQGFGGGGVKAALFNPVAVIKHTGEPGTVTQKQVDTTTAGEPKK